MLCGVLRHWCLALTGIAALGLAGCAEREDVDSGSCRSLEILVGFGVGGGTDLFARTFAEALRSEANAPVRVINLTAGSGVVAYRELMKRPADGCTLLAVTSDYMVLSAVQPDDVALDDLVFIARAHTELGLLSTRNDGSTLTDLIASANDEGRPLTIGGIGARSFDRAVVEYAVSDSDFDARYVAYDGAKAMHADLLGGRIDLMYDEYGVIRSLIDAGDVQPVVAFDTKPNGLPVSAPLSSDLRLATPPPIWRGLAVHGKTPQGRLDELMSQTKAALSAEGMVAYETSRFLVTNNTRLYGPAFEESVTKEEALFAEILN